MEKESSSKSASRLNFQSIIFGILIGIPITMVGMLIYINYFDQVNNLLLYILLVVFGVVVATLVLLWGFKPYLTRLLFGSKVADSPDLIAEAQTIASQLSDGIIDKVMENATDEQREKAKGLVLRLGNWFVWGRLRNWWWSWILGIFVSLGGLTGTLLLVNQNELLQNQNQLIKNQMSLEEASRRGALVMLMSNIFDKVDREIEAQREKMIEDKKVVTDSTKFKLSQSLIGQIAALSQAFKPYRFMDGDELIEEPLSPERGQLLITICGLPLDTLILENIFEKSNFEYADLGEAKLKRANLRDINLSYANLEGADISYTNLNYAQLYGANLFGVNLFMANLEEANLVGTDLRNSSLSKANLQRTDLQKSDLRYSSFGSVNFSRANLSEANMYGAFLGKANLNETNLVGTDLRGVQHLTEAQVKAAYSLYLCKFPSKIRVSNLKKTHPRLFQESSPLLPF